MKNLKKRFGTRDLVVISMLIGLIIIFERFLSIQTPIVRIGFAFIPIALTSILFGPILGGIAAAVADFIGILLFPTGGGFFPGFTLTAFLTGAVYGVFLHNKRKSFLNVSIAVVIVTFVLNLGLDTLWLYMIMDMGFVALLPKRIAKAIIMTPVQIFTIRILWNQVLCRLPGSIQHQLAFKCER
ncbi:folate family ECF transporter S component [Clostridium polynesiense]|uniref:folate family ECF transporter S component n=1 Tax=Clostridium polynesiense TaxID=1325933 RepID=UPI00058DB058|nr:folate family ECF transporter S component [Clostridium polynesiense]